MRQEVVLLMQKTVTHNKYDNPTDILELNVVYKNRNEGIEDELKPFKEDNNVVEKPAEKNNMKKMNYRKRAITD